MLRIEKQNLLNLLLFNISWVGLVFWNNAFLFVALTYIAIHLLYLSKLKNEWRLIVTVCAVGISVDSILLMFDVFIFEDRSHIPLWLMVLWACFATTICHSLACLDKYRTAQAIIGGGLAPFSYLAGEQFSAVSFSLSAIQTYLILAPIWSLLFLLFFYLKRSWVDDV